MKLSILIYFIDLYFRLNFHKNVFPYRSLFHCMETLLTNVIGLLAISFLESFLYVWEKNENSEPRKRRKQLYNARHSNVVANNNEAVTSFDSQI